MTDKQIIKLKPMEDLNEKIIKEKDNTKCIFYSDDICRNGDKTRDCVNCARVEYHSLYSLNWDNQERLGKIIKQKEQECEELKKQINDLLNKPEIQDKILWKIDNEALLGSKDAWIYKLEQALTAIKEIAKAQIPYLNIGTSKTMIEIEYDYAGAICNLKQRMSKILQKISECEAKDD